MIIKKIFVIDHGNRLIKTPYISFASGYVESGHQLMDKDVLKYNDKIYVQDDSLLPQLTDKTVNDRYLILTLFAIGKELEAERESGQVRHIRGELIDVTLLIGLPLINYQAFNERYVQYFKEPGIMAFEINGKSYSIRISEVYAYPQGFAAAISARKELEKTRVVNLIDVGGFTVDIARLTNLKPDGQTPTSLEWGVNNLFHRINEIARASGSKDIPVDVVEAILQNNEKAIRDASEKRLNLITSQAEAFAERILLEVSQKGLDLEEDTTAFIGGGSLLLKDYIDKMEKVKIPVFIENPVHANAIGYRLLYDAQQMKLEKAMTG